MYGYRIIIGQIEINESEAENVHMIFRNYIDGMGSTKITKKLSEMGIKVERWSLEYRKSTRDFKNE